MLTEFLLWNCGSCIFVHLRAVTLSTAVNDPFIYLVTDMLFSVSILFPTCFCALSLWFIIWWLWSGWNLLVIIIRSINTNIFHFHVKISSFTAEKKHVTAWYKKWACGVTFTRVLLPWLPATFFCCIQTEVDNDAANTVKVWASHRGSKWFFRKLWVTSNSV